MFSNKGTKLAYMADSKGLGDLKTKDVVELRELLTRQTNLLANKSVIHKLRDKGEKIKIIKDQLAEELQSREKYAVDLGKTVYNSTKWEWRDSNKGTSHETSKPIEEQTDEKDVMRMLSQNGHIPENKTHIQRLIDKEKDPHFTYKPYNLVVADKIKNIIPEAHTVLKGPISVKSLHLDESLELLTEQISALKILGKAARRKRVDECLEDRLDESAGEIEQELAEAVTDEIETKSSINISVNIKATF